jgi:adenosylcobinamide-GDP ribazoletransferase
VIPVPLCFSDRELGRSILFFPLAGLLIGIFVFLTDLLIKGSLFPLWLSSTIDVAMLAFISGALHLDGLADSADGLLSSRPPEQMLNIMKDSRIGTMGVLALLFVILLKIGALSSMDNSLRAGMIILAPLAGRCMILCWMSFFNYARQGRGMPHIFLPYLKKWQGAVAAILPLPAGLLLSGSAGLLAAGISILCVSLAGVYMNRKIGGYTGDTLGALSELSELAVFMAAAGIINVCQPS